MSHVKLYHGHLANHIPGIALQNDPVFNNIRPSPFFSLFSVVRPTQIFAFSKKKSYAEGNDTLFQTIVTLI